MLPDVTVPLPASLAGLLSAFAPVLHRPVLPDFLRPGLRIPHPGR
jgi:hypothetical protein